MVNRGIRGSLAAAPVMAVAAVALFVAFGCGRVSPIAVLNFVNQNQNSFPQGGGTVPPGPAPPTPVNSTCDLTDARSSIFFQLRNESVQNVAFSVTFLVSSGNGGFVCATDRPVYIAAGYAPIALSGPGNTTAIGCDTIALSAANGFRGGDELLGLTVVGQIGPNLSGTPTGAPVANPPLDGVTAIPVPEVIVLGDGDPLFICQGNNICTQGGFTYTNALGVQIDDVQSSRTQGTICQQVGATPRPEWRLLNPSSADTNARPFEYVAGASIAASVLDRVFNANPSQNKAVWRVIGPIPNLADIHLEQR